MGSVSSWCSEDDTATGVDGKESNMIWLSRLWRKREEVGIMYDGVGGLP